MKKFFFLCLKRLFFYNNKKIFKRFEKNTSHEAKIWAKQNTNFSTEEFCRLVDSNFVLKHFPEVI